MRLLWSRSRDLLKRQGSIVKCFSARVLCKTGSDDVHASPYEHNVQQRGCYAPRRNLKIEVGEKQSTIIQIQDNGDINKEDLDKVFEPFYSSRDERHGPGISHVQTNVSQHSGTMRIMSEKLRAQLSLLLYQLLETLMFPNKTG